MCEGPYSEEIYGKSTLGMAYNAVRYIHSFSCVAALICEILRKFELIAVQGHPRSSILVSIESAYAPSY